MTSAPALSSAHLRELTIDVLKIDKYVVDGIAVSHEAARPPEVIVGSPRTIVRT